MKRRFALLLAEDGKNEVRLLKRPFPNFFVMDLKMPRLNGLEVLAWLKQHEEYQRLPKFCSALQARKPTRPKRIDWA